MLFRLHCDHFDEVTTGFRRRLIETAAAWINLAATRW
jgi:hypothetical protein